MTAPRRAALPKNRYGCKGCDWPVRVVEGRADGGYTDAFELICCDCGDHPDVDYRDVSTGLQRIRGPYPLAAGVAAYDKHLKLNHEQAPESRIPTYVGENLWADPGGGSTAPAVITAVSG